MSGFYKRGRPVRVVLRLSAIRQLNVRRLVGGWKLLFLDGGTFTSDPSQSAQWNRGPYLVNGPGHCAECHSPRNRVGAIVTGKRFTGHPTPYGVSGFPNITQLKFGEMVGGRNHRHARDRHDAGRQPGR